MLTVSITEAQWDKWGRPGGWTTWEPDTRPEHFLPNLAVVVCKGVFNDAVDPKLKGKVCHYMAIARVLDCIELLPFNQLREAFNHYDGATTGVWLVQLHRANKVFPDLYFQYYGKHFTILGLSDPEIQFGMADEFVGGYLVRRHVAASGRKAQAMLPPGYIPGATCPQPSPTYPYHPGGTGSPAQHPPIRVIFLTPKGKFIASPGRFCIGEAPASEWPFNDAPVPWILPESYRNPNETVPDFQGRDDQIEGFPDRGPEAAPLNAPEATTHGDADDEDEGFETVGDDEEVPGDTVLVSIPAEKVAKPEGSGFGGIGKIFESEEEDDPEVKEQIEAALAESGPLAELQLSESKDRSGSGTPDDDDDEGDPNVTKQYYQGQEEEVVEDSELKPRNSTLAAAADPPVVLGNPGNPGGSNPDTKDIQPTKPIPSRGKGPNSVNSSKAPAPKPADGANPQLSPVAQGVQERAQSTLFGAAALAQATGTEEDAVRRLQNYTGLLMGLQRLVITMASSYEAATEDIRALVASTLDMATQHDRAFVAGASQALANWTEKYQQAMSQGENQSIHDQLAHWDQVREAGVTLSQEITSLTTDYEPGTASSEIFWTLLPACFHCICARTEAMFLELNASLPTLLCQCVTPDQAGHMLSSIFTCMCNYNTEICGMAMAQTVVPVYTIPNTYWVQQSLWESICWIIPGIARTSGSELRTLEPAAPRNTPVGQADTVPTVGNSGDPGTRTAKTSNSQGSTTSSSTRKKKIPKETQPAGVPVGIPPARSIWVPKRVFQHIPMIDLEGDEDPPSTRPQETSTPIKPTPASDRSHSGKKLDVSKIHAAHLLSEMQDRHEKLRKKESETKGQVKTSQRISGGECGSDGPGRAPSAPAPCGLPATLPKLSDRDRTFTKPTAPAPEVTSQGTKRPLDVADEVAEILDDKAAGPPKKKKKKKNKNKDRSKDETPSLETQDDGVRPSTSAAKSETAVEEPMVVDTVSRTPEEATKTSKKKKKKKDAELERFRLEQREAKAKEMAKAKHRKLQHA